MNTEKISDEKYIFVALEDDGIEVTIKYGKRSTLIRRFEMIDKLREVIRKI
jgi:hypothetical protein